MTKWLAAASEASALPAWANVKDFDTQPYFANVGRAVAALANRAAPIAATDAQQIVELAKQNDLAAVDAAEKIMDRYTLARLSVEADG